MTIDPSLINELKDTGMPGFSGKSNEPMSLENYRVRYFKASLDELSDIAELEHIESLSLKKEKDVILLSKDKFSFQDGYYIILQYLEKRGTISRLARDNVNAELAPGPSIEEIAKGKKS